MINIVEGNIEMIQFDQDSWIVKMNKSEGITVVFFSLDELDNTNKKPLGLCLLGDRLGVWFHLKD